jgi:hypothetical protein
MPEGRKRRQFPASASMQIAEHSSAGDTVVLARVLEFEGANITERQLHAMGRVEARTTCWRGSGPDGFLHYIRSNF